MRRVEVLVEILKTFLARRAARDRHDAEVEGVGDVGRGGVRGERDRSTLVDRASRGGRGDEKGALEAYTRSLVVEWNQPPIIEAKSRLMRKLH